MAKRRTRKQKQRARQKLTYALPDNLNLDRPTKTVIPSTNKPEKSAPAPAGNDTRLIIKDLIKTVWVGAIIALLLLGIYWFRLHQ